MGRPAKAVVTKSGKMSKAEELRRLENEEALKGSKDKINKAPAWFTARQKKIRKELAKELEKVLTNVDSYVLNQAVVAISRLEEIDKIINENPQKMTEKSIISAKKEYASVFFRCCSELSMSPQSRAKLANCLVQPETKKNPLSALLEDDEDV